MKLLNIIINIVTISFAAGAKPKSREIKLSAKDEKTFLETVKKCLITNNLDAWKLDAYKEEHFRAILSDAEAVCFFKCTFEDLDILKDNHFQVKTLKSILNNLVEENDVKKIFKYCVDVADTEYTACDSEYLKYECMVTQCPKIETLWEIVNRTIIKSKWFN